MEILFHLVTIVLAIGLVNSKCARRYDVNVDQPSVALVQTEAQRFLASVPLQGD